MASSANRYNDDHGHNATMMQAFEWYTPGGGNHWTWLANNAERFADMGITALWVPPPYKGASTDSTGYDAYDMWDLGEFAVPRDEGNQEPANRTKYGTRQEFEDCLKKLRECRISIYIDCVMNHKAGADETELFKAREVDSNNRKKLITEAYDIEGWTKFYFPGRKDKYSSMKWSFNHFTGVDWDQKGGKKSIFRIEGDGKKWADDVDNENGNFDYLMASDIDHAHPEVRDDLMKWGSWMVHNFPISGFRFDAVKHMSRHFVHDFVKHTREEFRLKRKNAGKEPLDESEGPIAFSVGEFWKDSVDSCLNYLSNFGDEQFSLFDAPLHYAFKEAGDGGREYDLRKIFDGTIVQSRPIDSVTLVENHDTQAGQALESVVPANFKPLAYAIILLRESGYPCVFLGDLDGTHSDGDHQPSEQSMSNLDKFIKCRKYFAYGEQHEYWDHPQCVGWVRTGDKDHPGCAVVLCNGDGEGRKRMQIGTPGEKWVDAIGWKEGELTIGEDGWCEFESPASSCSVWVRKEDKEKYKM
ncbi:hypothetical protein CBS101457_000037 [Exobasidium rhododendri]|nr:hypothetical protein CBS101457_000037 [Exobasidium rhododendri]